MRTQVELLRELMALDPPLHIFGGIAEDALLAGRMTRTHEDIDLVVFRDELDLRLDQAAALGFERFHLRFMPEPGRPLVIGSIVGDLNLEIVIFDREKDGRIWFDTTTAEGGLKRVWFPEGALDHPPSSLEGVEVRTVSPLTLYQLRVAVAETFGGFRPKDVVAQTKLRAHFFAGVPEEKLAPRTEALAPLTP